ncbi:MAG: GAF domain-containing protein [Caldimonas sp.]
MTDLTSIPSTAGTPPGGAELLAQITAGLSEGKDLRALLDRFLEPIVALAGAKAGAVRLLSDSGERLQLVSDVGLPSAVHPIEDSVDRHCGVCGMAADQRRFVWATDLSVCAERSTGEFFGRECQRMLAVPLQHKGRLLGVYNLFFGDHGEPAPPITALLRSVGELLGLALDNARLENESVRATVLHERQVMAAELHDSIAQTLTFVKMRLPLLEDAMVGHDDPRSLKYLADVRDAVGEAHARLREIVTHFRTRMDPRGLSYALDALAARYRQRSDIELSYVNLAPELRMTIEVETEVFHIVQEALANIERHSHAGRAWLSVERAGDGVEIRVEDDGIGPAKDERCDEAAHFGIGIMGERAARLGGELTITERAARGTLVRLVIPAPPRGGATR